MKALLYLYPTKEYIDFTLEHDSIFHRLNSNEKRRDKLLFKEFKKAKTEKEKEELREIAIKFRADCFRPTYKHMLNKCIDIRYRQKGFSINYALFDGHEVSDIIDLRPEDKLIRVGIDFATHVLEKKYPKPDVILNQLREVKTLRVAGFHRQDCVDKVARRAYERQLDVLVDEDLTESFGYLIKDKAFRMEHGPNFNPRKVKGSGYFEGFMKAREGKPWLWQNY